MDRPIITTVQQLGAAVQGIEAQREGQITVTSLQEHATRLGQGRRTAAGGGSGEETS